MVTYSQVKDCFIIAEFYFLIIGNYLCLGWESERNGEREECIVKMQRKRRKDCKREWGRTASRSNQFWLLTMEEKRDCLEESQWWTNGRNAKICAKARSRERWSEQKKMKFCKKRSCLLVYNTLGGLHTYSSEGGQCVADCFACGHIIRGRPWSVVGEKTLGHPGSPPGLPETVSII